MTTPHITDSCYLEYVEGYLACTFNHKAGDECLMDRDYPKKEDYETPPQQTHEAEMFDEKFSIVHYECEDGFYSCPKVKDYWGNGDINKCYCGAEKAFSLHKSHLIESNERIRQDTLEIVREGVIRLFPTPLCDKLNQNLVNVIDLLDSLGGISRINENQARYDRDPERYNQEERRQEEMEEQARQSEHEEERIQNNLTLE